MLIIEFQKNVDNEKIILRYKNIEEKEKLNWNYLEIDLLTLHNLIGNYGCACPPRYDQIFDYVEINHNGISVKSPLKICDKKLMYKFLS